VYERYRDQGLQAYFLISGDASNSVPLPEYCASIRDQFGLTMPVLYGRQLNDAGLNSRHVHLVMEEGMKIIHREVLTDSTFEAAIEQALAP